MQEFVIRGTRGTAPACGEDFRRYGGNTTCFSIETDDGLVVFDAGTGISSIAREFAGSAVAKDITIFFTHMHMDHLMGLPSFQPLYDPEVKIRLMADPRRDEDWKEDLGLFMRKPFWPIGLLESQSDMSLLDLPVTEDGIEMKGLNVSWMRVPHPQQCVAYRIRTPQRSVVIATDVEYTISDIDPVFIDFCGNADHLIYDSQYLPPEFAAHRNWGHSTWETAVEVASRAGVAELILTHHEPSRTDSEIDEIVQRAGEVFSSVRAAADGDRLCGP